MQFTVDLVNRGWVVDVADRDGLEVFAEHVPRTATEREYQVGVNVPEFLNKSKPDGRIENVL
jgi:hypothetical protein